VHSGHKRATRLIVALVAAGFTIGVFAFQTMLSAMGNGIANLTEGLLGSLQTVDLTKAPLGSKILLDGDSVGAVLGVIRGGARKDAVGIVAVADSTLLSRGHLAGFTSVPIHADRAIVIRLDQRAEGVGRRRVADLILPRLPEPLPVYALGDANANLSPVAEPAAAPDAPHR
jgi:hypothetical protein